jgi:glutamate-1-semialdehyde 2,1-aminomutase
VDGALAVYARALDSTIDRFLVGRHSQVVFRRYNKGDERAEITTVPATSVATAESKQTATA